MSREADDAGALMQTLDIRAADGFSLAGTLYGDRATCHSAVLMAPAIGVPQRFYARFSQWLVEQGHAVLTFDYRGMGASRPAAMRRSLRGLEADVCTWAQLDAAAALEALAARVAPDTPLHWIGHSLGGQILGLVPNHHRLTSAVTVAVGTGYWRDHDIRLKSYVWLLWFVAAPIAMYRHGYFRGKRLRAVGDLPLGVMQQWRRWCLHPDYLLGEGGDAWRQQYAALRVPMLSVSFTDDELMSTKNTDDMHAMYTGVALTRWRVSPHDVGMRRIGHFGFFRDGLADKLWPQVSHWLKTHD